VFLFFYDPHCGHCDQAARDMSQLHWKSDVTVVAIPTNDARFAAAFLQDTGLKAMTSVDLEMLKKIFPFGDPPYGVALENGREKGPVARFEGTEPGETLRKFGYVE
jgi:thiol-disulfide isomerase/thioredoxin